MFVCACVYLCAHVHTRVCLHLTGLPDHIFVTSFPNTITTMGWTATNSPIPPSGAAADRWPLSERCVCFWSFLVSYAVFVF